MQLSPPQRAERLLALYSELKMILASERGEEWLKHVDPIVKALTPPFESDLQCIETIEEATRRFNALLSFKGGLSEYYVHRNDPQARVEANRRLSQLIEILSAG